MSRRRAQVLVVLFGVFCLVGVSSAVAQESEEQMSEAGQSKFRLVPHVGVSGAIASIHVVPGVAFRYQPGFLGVGADLKAFQGLYPVETYGVGHVMLHLGPIYLAGGGSYPLVYPSDENKDNDKTYYYYADQLLPSFALGTMFRFNNDEKNSLGLRIGAEWTTTGYLLELKKEPESFGEALGTAIGAGIAGGLVWAFNSLKANISLTYSYGL